MNKREKLTLGRAALSLIIFSVASVSLTSCAPALKASDFKVALSAGEYEYALTGDTIPFESQVSLTSSENLQYSLKIEEQSESKPWRQVALLKDVQGASESEIPVSVSGAGVFTYRATIYSGDQSIVSSKPIEVTVKDLRNEVRKFYYDERIACEQDGPTCFDWQLKNSYPGLFSLTSSYKNAIRANWFSGETATPDLDSIEPDPEWLFPVYKCERTLRLIKLDVSDPLPGRTFVAKRGGSYVHVTYLKGSLYYYPSFCS